MNRSILRSFVWGAVMLGLTLDLPADEGAATPQEVFNQRIMPIFRSPQPASCVQCHLAAVDLKNYILPSCEQTFLALRDQGLVDVNHPQKSKILTLIQMGEQDLDEKARMIHAKMRKAEYEAFSDWIKACCEDETLRGLAGTTAPVGPQVPLEVVRHARKSRVVDSFARNVWSQRLRCFPCHTPHEIDPSNPRHQGAIKKQREFEAQHSPELVARMRIFKRTPEETLQYLIEASRSTASDRLPMINIEQPMESLILRKPLSKLPAKLADGSFEEPSSAGQVTHMGGLKLHPNDQSYKSIVAWLTDYARVSGDSYTSIDALPADNWYGSALWLRIKDLPEEWRVGTPAQLHVHAWSESAGEFEVEPVAFTQSVITPRRLVNGTLFLLGSGAESDLKVEKNTLPAGRYLVKCYLDSEDRLAEDPTLLLGRSEFRGQIELKKARWRPLFRRAEVASAKTLEQ